MIAWKEVSKWHKCSSSSDNVLCNFQPCWKDWKTSVFVGKETSRRFTFFDRFACMCHIKWNFFLLNCMLADFGGAALAQKIRNSPLTKVPRVRFPAIASEKVNVTFCSPLLVGSGTSFSRKNLHFYLLRMTGWTSQIKLRFTLSIWKEKGSTVIKGHAVPRATTFYITESLVWQVNRLTKSTEVNS